MVESFPRGVAITAIAAKDLAKRKRFGAQDPYLAFYLQGRRKFTIVAVKGGVKPEWNQTIKYNRIHDAVASKDTTLVVYCIHEKTGVKTGVKMGSSDGLIGSCEIDLKQTLFSSEAGVYDGWFKLMFDGKKSGQVHLRLQLCEPSDEEDKPENAPLRLDHKSRIVRSKSEKRADKKIAMNAAALSSPSSEGGRPQPSTSTAGRSGDGVQRAPTSRLSRPRSMADLKERQSTIKFQEPIQRRISSKSMEDVRDSNISPTADSSDAEEDDRRISSPKQTFTLQDSNGNINQLNLLIAPFDPSWLEPTPPILRRALSAQFYYDDLQMQMSTNPRELFPRSQSRQDHTRYSGESIYDQNRFQSFQSFGQAQQLRPQPQPQLQNQNQNYKQELSQAQQPQPQPQNQNHNYKQELSQAQQPQPQPQNQNQMQALGQPGHTGAAPVHSYLPQQYQHNQHSPTGQLNMPQPGMPQPSMPQPSMPQPSMPQPGVPQPSMSQPGIPMPQPQHHSIPNQRQLPPPSQQTWLSHTQSSVAYQPHTVFQPRQSTRSRMDSAGNLKFVSLPSRNHISPNYLQQLRNIGESTDQTAATQQGGMAMNIPEPFPRPGSTAPTLISPTKTSSLGPAAGYLPETYSKDHQRALSSQLPSPAPPVIQPHAQASLGPDPRNVVHRAAGVPSEPERPGTSNSFYIPQPSSTLPSAPVMSQAPNGQAPAQPVYFASPTPLQQQYGTSQQTQQSSTNYNQPSASSFSGGNAFSAMVKSPATSVPAKIPVKAKDPIFYQYKPRPVTWDGKDIQDSFSDSHLGRRILARYALGINREKYVREGFFVKERGPFLADSAQVQQRQLQQKQQQKSASQRQLQRQFTMDQGGNDRVILKYFKSRREWEVDCVMVRYLTCQHPEEKLESQYLDYPQPLQNSQVVNPFVMGLYETFIHPQGTDLDGCRYLSVVQWFPETLRSYIDDRIASGEGFEMTMPIIRSLIECMEWIHSRRICHLNIKPSNFVRDPYMASSIDRASGTGWKLVDFEAARVIDEDVVGRCTISYAAPEVLVGLSSSIGVQAKGAMDIWSLGLVVFELLTDQPLFRTDDHAKEVLLNNSRAMKTIRYYDSKTIDPEYHGLLDAMLAYDPAKRLTASQLLKLDIFTKPISARPISQDKMIKNNSILSLRDLKATRLCNLGGGVPDKGSGDGRGVVNSHGSGDSGYGSAPSHQTMMLEGIGRVLDSPFDQIPRLFMLLPPRVQDLDPTQPFQPNNLFHNKCLRLVLLCEGLSGYGEDAHVTDHRGYLLHDSAAFVKDVGKLLLHLVAVTGTSNPGYQTPASDSPLTLTGTPLDNCQGWYPSLMSYYEVLQSSIQRQIGAAPSLNELRSLRGPMLKVLEQWLVRLVRKECQLASEASIRGTKSNVAVSGGNGGSASDELPDQMAIVGFQDVDLPEVTGPGGGEGYGGLYKMPVGTCGDRWICRGCVSKQMAMAN